MMRNFDKRVKDRKRSNDELHNMIVKGSYGDFLALTSGRLTAKDRKKAGYPYARGGSSKTGVGDSMRGLQTRSGTRFRIQNPTAGKITRAGRQISKKGQLSLLPINMDTRELRKGIRLKGPFGHNRKFALYSEAAHASFVLSLRGTPTMVARRLLGPDGELRRRHNGRMAVLRKHLRNENGST